MIFEYMEHDLNVSLRIPTSIFPLGNLKESRYATLLRPRLPSIAKRCFIAISRLQYPLEQSGLLKLAEFGLREPTLNVGWETIPNRVVTLWYRPPELLFGATQYGSEVDMWGAGCIFLELFVKKPVFQSETEIGQVTAITDCLDG